jgi:hypothetical protein
VAGVQEALPIGEAGVGEQELSHESAVACEGALEAAAQIDLADGRRGLLFGNRLRAGREPEA